MAGLSDGEAGRICHRTPMSAPGLRLFSICDRHHDRPGASRHGRGNRAPWAPAHRTEEGPDVSRAVPQRKRDGARDRIEKKDSLLSLSKKSKNGQCLFQTSSLNILLYLLCGNKQRFVSTPLIESLAETAFSLNHLSSLSTDSCRRPLTCCFDTSLQIQPILGFVIFAL